MFVGVCWGLESCRKCGVRRRCMWTESECAVQAEDNQLAVQTPTVRGNLIPLTKMVEFCFFRHRAIEANMSKAFLARVTYTRAAASRLSSIEYRGKNQRNTRRTESKSKLPVLVNASPCLRELQHPCWQKRRLLMNSAMVHDPFVWSPSLKPAGRDASNRCMVVLTVAPIHGS